ncbi:MAG TPA: cytochrome c-type biogenesis protein [Steroidobacteraceae bacterium]|nr:cytochrome c-type biogenesis protein [Steroidobacteraceae bacterium]
MRASITLAIVLVGLLGFTPPQRAWAVDPAQMSDPALQARYEVLIHELRCVQCEDNSLADSDASIAADLRHQIRDMLSAGKTDGEIKAYLVSRYSEFILFRPEYSWRNAWLWALPAVLLLLGVFVAVRVIRQRAALIDDDPVDDDAGVARP